MFQYKDRAFQAFIIYISLLLDNVLLTVIVPILPDYLSHLKADILPNSLLYKNFDLHYVPTILGKHPIPGNSPINFTLPKEKDKFDIDERIDIDIIDESDGVYLNLDDENSSVGILLGTKALVQLVITPIVGNLTLRLGYRMPIVFGTFCLFIASFIFAIGNSYYSLLIARALQGVASACIGVCGMSLVAQLYPENDKRSKVMGVVLGSVALGVLVGYPFGGILYDFIGKAAPFYILSILISFDLILQLSIMDLKDSKAEVVVNPNGSKYCVLFNDSLIVKIAFAILVSTSAMAILEPCLPIWLLENLHPKKWQIGTVFIPDSIGYFIGTNFFGSITYAWGQIKSCVGTLILIGLSCYLIPNATSVLNLMIPHFLLGLSIGILDAALVPLLASLVDSKYEDDDSNVSDSSMSNYGAVYAIQQMSVSLAYSVAPILGGEITPYIGFRWLMIIIGSLNILYGLYMLSFFLNSTIKTTSSPVKDILLKECQTNKEYNRFYDSVDIP